MLMQLDTGKEMDWVPLDIGHTSSCGHVIISQTMPDVC